ncbi:MAG: hypothetical protein CVU56_01630 [Deltaproteobacteria bacterium HGW-Deltaproteobacteria-14]|nr:MAG: hypothetical protein CVU56_01630 [Deltaproteobacteria bacterium HGW-Deltaproteobacteria-14]
MLVEPDNGDPIVYTTRDCWTVKVDDHTITISDPATIGSYQSWGDPHENLNGKHVKDWLSGRRSIAFGGAMLTLHAQGPTGVVESLTIYDGPRSYTIACPGNLVIDRTLDAASTVAREDAEADGEAGCLANKADGGLLFDGTYQQDEGADGKPMESVPSPVRIAETFGPQNPHQVNDYYPPLPDDVPPAVPCVASKP